MDYKEFALGKTLSLKEQVYETIRMKIINGELMPEMRLQEEKLCSEMGVSRAPIREAFNMLDRDGFIRIIPRKGAVVADISPRDVEMLWNVRMLLEPCAAVMSMGNIPERELLALKEKLEDLRNDPSDFAKYMETDIAVHTLLMDYLDNHYLKDILRNLKEHSMRMRWNVERKKTEESTSTVVVATEEHIEMVQAAIEGDSKKLYDAVLHHLITSKIRTMNNSNGGDLGNESFGKKVETDFVQLMEIVRNN